MAVDPMQRLRDIERELRVAEGAPPKPSIPPKPTRVPVSTGASLARPPIQIEESPPVDALGRVEGRDSSGAIGVLVGSDGLPESVRVAPDWLRVVGAERFATALGEAARAATEELSATALAAFGEQDAAELAALSRDLERVLASDGTGDLLDDAPLPPARPLGDVLTEAFAAMEEMTRWLEKATADPPRGTGSTGFGKLTITLAPDGSLSCTADPFWLSQLDASELIDALNRALDGARTDLARATAGISGARLAGIAEQLHAALRDLTPPDLTGRTAGE